MYFSFMKYVLLFAVFLLIACASQSKLKSKKLEIVCFDQHPFDSVVMADLMSLNPKEIRCFDTITFPYEIAIKQFQAKGLELFVDRKGLNRWYSDFQYNLVAHNYQSYISGMASGKGNKIHVLKSQDLYAALKLEKTNGINYGLTTEKVIEKLEEWDTTKLRLMVVGAGHDWVTLRIIKSPESWYDFSKSVYKFCPDIADDNPTALINFTSNMKKTLQFTMWWD